MIKGFVSEKARNWETICTSGGGKQSAPQGAGNNLHLKGHFLTPHRAWLLRIFPHQKSSAFKYIPCDQWRSQGSDAGCKRAVALGRGV